MGLLQALRPDWWFSAHLHVRFEAVVKHGGGEQGPSGGDLPVVAANPDEIVISDEDADEDNISREAALTSEVRTTMPQNPDENEITLVDGELSLPGPVVSQSETKFLALDKCLPRRAFLEVFFAVV